MWINILLWGRPQVTTRRMRIAWWIPTKSKGIPRQAEVTLGVPGRLRPRIFSTFGTTRVVGRQPNSPAAFTPGKIPGTHFQRLIRPQGTWFCRKEPREKSQLTLQGIDPGTVRLVAQHLNHYGYLLRLQIHTGCVIPIDFPLQRWLHEHASMLRYTYIICVNVYYRQFKFDHAHNAYVYSSLHVSVCILDSFDF